MTRHELAPIPLGRGLVRQPGESVSRRTTGDLRPVSAQTETRILMHFYALAGALALQERPDEPARSAKRRGR